MKIAIQLPLTASLWLAAFLLLPQANASEPSSASHVLQKAHEARATWNNFPGFTADIIVNIDGVVQKGKATVSAKGKVDLSNVNLKDHPQVLRSVQSLVNHRLDSPGSEAKASYPDDNLQHPAGRLIKDENDTLMAASYRVRGDVTYQVNRMMGVSRFVISIFSVYRNQEGKILPESYNYCFWNGDGTLMSSTTVRDEWIRVGKYDLPAVYSSVNAEKDLLTNVRVEFTNHKLTATIDE